MPPRWPAIRSNVTGVRAGNRLVGPPADGTVTGPCTGTPCSESFQAIRRASAFMPASVCATVMKPPMQDTPVETLLKPCACAPTISLSMSPARPSKIWPYLSTRKL